MTARDIIKSALRSIGAIATGETPSADELSDGILSLNRMLGSWSNDGLLIPSVTREAFPLVAGQQTYTIGTSGNFNTSRPMKVVSVAIQDPAFTPKQELPILVLNHLDWAEVTVKEIDSTIPTKVYVEPTAPLMNLHFWPKPNTNCEAVIYSEKPLASYSNATDDVLVPPGYEDAIIFNLATRLAPEYGRPVSGEVAALANETKSAIQSMNTILPTMDASPMGSNKQFNILTGGY